MATIVAVAAQPIISRGVGNNVWQVGHRMAVRLTRRAQWGHNFLGLLFTNELNSPGAMQTKKAQRLLIEPPICLTAHNIPSES
jgi:hypothetical protein